MALTEPRKAIRLVIVAAVAILDVHISRALGILSAAVLRDVTLSRSLTTCGAIRLELAVLTAQPLPAVRTINQRTRHGIAARVLTFLCAYEIY